MKKKKVYIYIIHRTVFHANMESYPVQYERQHKSFTHIEHHIGVAGWLHSSLLRIYFPGFIACVASVSNRVIARKLERKRSFVPLPLPRHSFSFCSRSNFLDEPREETLATQATGFTVLIPIHTAKKSAKNLSDM